MGPASIPLTVIGGYLGAGKTTLVNHLLRNPGGRRLGVVVNDFGELAIDVGLLAAAGAGDIVSLTNGCVCCTLGEGLQQTLSAMTSMPDPPDQIVIEVSGVADPAATAAWGTVPPFVPGGTIVLAAADSIRRQAADRYVGGEVRRQLVGADLVVITKTDLVDEEELPDVIAWIDEVAGFVPRVTAGRRPIPTELVLGDRFDPVGSARSSTAPDRRGPTVPPVPTGLEPDDHVNHDDYYVRWKWESDRPLPGDAPTKLLRGLPPGVLRLKGWIALEGGDVVHVDVVGRYRSAKVPLDRSGSGSRLVAIGHRARFRPRDLDDLLERLVGRH